MYVISLLLIFMYGYFYYIDFGIWYILLKSYIKLVILIVIWFDRMKGLRIF